MSKLPTFEHFLSVGNLKPKLRWFFKLKLRPNFFLLNLAPGSRVQRGAERPGKHLVRGGRADGGHGEAHGGGHALAKHSSMHSLRFHVLTSDMMWNWDHWCQFHKRALDLTFTEWGCLSVTRFCRSCFGKFPWRNGRYCRYLLPRQALATQTEKNHKI